MVLLALALCGWICPDLPASPSVEARFYFEKELYQAGEPVFLYFEVRNSGDEPIAYMPPTAFGDCAGLSGLRIDAETAEPVREEVYFCSSGYAGSCMGGYHPLGPRQSYTQRFLLNQQYRLDQPGSYPVKVSYELRYGSPTDYELGVRQSVEGRLWLNVVEGDEASLQAAYAPLLDQLQDEDLERRWTAVNAIAVMAPPFLEPALLQLAREDNPVSTQVARALRKLNTPATREELARQAEEAVNRSTRQEAVWLLGRMGDREYLPLLQRLADDSDPSVRHAAIVSLGRLGREDALPFLQRALQDKDAGIRQHAILGLANSGQRGAIPLLIGMLGDEVDWLRWTAAEALSQMTHRTARLDVRHPAQAAAAAQRWVQWWMLNGQKAELFGPDQCATPEPLP